MRSLHVLLCVTSFLCANLLPLQLSARSQLHADEDGTSFSRTVGPILAEKCIQCHGPDEARREADLRLDVGTEDESQRTALEHSLLERINAADPQQRMPPPEFGKSLTEVERRQLEQWIQAGAKFESHWAFQPIAQVRSADGSEPTLDALVAQALNAQGLVRAQAISNSQWLRRVSIDLTGIPPTWEELQAFERDASPEAAERVVDELLASPAYGQRWGKYWLDLARYADTHGGAAIGFTSFPFSYTYRDYVIQAFNDDRPYDQFVIEQLAADQLELEPHDPRLAALGFLTVGMQFRNKHDTLDDQIDVVTRGLMGLTVTCARCHDHKFDPIPTRDYYAIYATLVSSSVPRELPTLDTDTAPAASEEQRSAYFQQLGSLKMQYADMARDQIEVMQQRLRMQTGLYLRELAQGLPAQDVATTFLSYRTDDIRPIVYNRWRAHVAGLGPQDPVFGLWHQLSNLPREDFHAGAIALLAARAAELPDKSSAGEYHALGSSAPKWNPLLVEALQSKPLHSMLDVADAYAELFTRVHQEWLQALYASALEAVSSEAIIPDEDARHLVVNSPVYRQLRWHLYGQGTPTDLPDDIAAQLLNRTIADSLGGKRGAIHAHHLNAPGSVPRAMVLEEQLAEQEAFVFLRGNHMSLGEKVKPGFLTALAFSPNELDYLPGKRRLALAQAIAAPDNPLTPRVITNWIWQQHFGQGLVRTTDDFGTRGTPPSHPSLLDFLAGKFIEDGWSIKQMQRRIVLSETYRVAALEIDASRAIDPENSLLWRMPRRRLDFEAMRDSMLRVAGELDLSTGGRPIDLAATPASNRRTVYGFVNRDIVSNLSSTFDSANPNACTLKRPDTLVPQQTLFALNSDFIQERAARLAALLHAEELADNGPRVEWLYRRIYARSATADEIAVACQYIAQSDHDRWQSLAHAMLASNEFSFVD